MTMPVLATLFSSPSLLAVLWKMSITNGGKGGSSIFPSCPLQLFCQILPKLNNGPWFLSIGDHVVVKGLIHQHLPICNDYIKQEPEDIDPRLFGCSVCAVVGAKLINMVYPIHHAVVLGDDRLAWNLLDLSVAFFFWTLSFL